MKSINLRGSLVALLVFCIPGQANAEGSSDKPAKALQVTKKTQALEVRQSQIGYRDTLLFYTFLEHKTVLKLQISNRDTTFPMTGTIYSFAGSVTPDGLKKWLNNQHSDALFPDVPEPISTLKIPAKLCKVKSHKLINHSKLRFGEYDNYAVKFQVKDYKSKSGIKLKGFAGATKVHIKTN